MSRIDEKNLRIIEKAIWRIGLKIAAILLGSYVVYAAVSYLILLLTTGSLASLL